MPFHSDEAVDHGFNGKLRRAREHMINDKLNFAKERMTWFFTRTDSIEIWIDAVARRFMIDSADVGNDDNDDDDMANVD